MRKVRILVNNIPAGVLEEFDHHLYRFSYENHYEGPPISLTMPLEKLMYEFDKFPAFFEGLLPEGIMLEALLRKYKLDKNDYFGQLLKVGQDLVGAITVEELK